MPETSNRTALDVAREVFPDVPQDELEYTIWNRTGFPSFWPARYKTPETALRGQLKAFKRALEGLREGEQLCEFCNRKARGGDRFPLCKRCAEVLGEERGD